MSDQQPKPIHNLSSRVLSIAQILDMLPAGDYSFRLTKPDLPGLSWHFEAVRIERICDKELPRRTVEMIP